MVHKKFSLNGIYIIFILCFTFQGWAWGSDDFRSKTVEALSGKQAVSWGMSLKGIFLSQPTEKKVLALTFDACGGRKNDFDKEIIDYLIEKNIPATLFLNERWITDHPQEFAFLASNSLFEIGNHGTLHRPLSVNGSSAYGIKGTQNLEEAFDEVEKNALKIELLTGKKPVFFRSGTAHYDNVSVQLVLAMGYKIAGFSINGDEGGTLSPEKVEYKMLAAHGGDIILFHMNRPGSGTANGIKKAIPKLLNEGFYFVTLSELTKKAMND